jgi:C-terminal processing protease CtpA/Prc
MPRMIRTNFSLKLSFFGLCAISLVQPAQQSERNYGIGVSLTGSEKTCPIFVLGVRKNSPAAQAGIRPGDRVISVDGSAVKTAQEAAQLTTSRSASPVRLEMAREDRVYSVTVRREEFIRLLRNDGLRMIASGAIVDANLTEAEITHFLSISSALENAKDISTAFPGHYPANKDLYYPGFEVFTWDAGTQVVVGGIEDGPAYREGIRWGDRIIAVNGVDPRKKTAMELESLLSSPKATSISLVVKRGNLEKTVSVELAKAADILRDNHWQVVNGKLIPFWVPEKYRICFE